MDRSEVMDKFWAEFLVWLKDNQDEKVNTAMVMGLDGLFWLWYADTKLPAPTAIKESGE